MPLLLLLLLHWIFVIPVFCLLMKGSNVAPPSGSSMYESIVRAAVGGSSVKALPKAKKDLHEPLQSSVCSTACCREMVSFFLRYALLISAVSGG